jgi:hypothetical protein
MSEAFRIPVDVCFGFSLIYAMRFSRYDCSKLVARSS